MRKKILLSLTILTFFFLFVPLTKAQVNNKTVIFFHSVTCPPCVTVEKYLLEEANAGKFSLLEFENSNFPNLRAEFDTAFGVASAAKNSIPIVFVGRQYLAGNAITSDLETVLASLKQAAYAYPLTFLANSKNYASTPMTPAKPLPKTSSEKQAFYCWLLLTLAILFLPFWPRKSKRA